jgi:thiamine kinase-like enzyme
MPSSIQRQRSRLLFFLQKLTTSNSLDKQQVNEIVTFVSNYLEKQFLNTNGDQFVQVHGDFQPTNIICGFDIALEPQSRFIGAIDFEHTHLMVPAYDVGYFLAQLHFQFRHHSDVYREGLSEEFIEWWQEKLCASGPTDIVQQVSFFSLLTNISIMAFLVMMGQGASEDISTLLHRCEAQMVRLQRC